MDGPSSDLYTYDTKTNEIKRLTSGEHQVGVMFWSPDSKWIVHEEIMGGIGCYAYNMWAASPNGSEVKWLYQPERHLCLSLRGWLDNSRFVTYGHPIEGMGFIRETNLNTNESTLLYSSIFPFGGPFLDRENEVIAFYSNKDERNHIEEEGIYILPINNPTPQHISIEKQSLNYDYKQNFFYVSIICSDESGVEGYWGFKSDGITYCTHPTSSPSDSISPDQKWVFPYHTNELCSYPEQKCIYTFGDGNSFAVWRPDSQGFFVFTRETLHYIPLDTLTPILIDDQFSCSIRESSFYSPQWIGNNQNRNP